MTINTLVARGLDALERELREDARGTFRLGLATDRGEIHVYVVSMSDPTGMRHDLATPLTVHLVTAQWGGAPHDRDSRDWLIREPDPSAPEPMRDRYTVLLAREAIEAIDAGLAGRPEIDVPTATVYAAMLQVCDSTGEWVTVGEAYDGIALGLLVRLAAGPCPEVLA